MKVVFRVEGNPDIGLGHVMRCMALAQSLVLLKHEVFFFMSLRSQIFCHTRADWQGNILPIDNPNETSEPEWLSHKCVDMKIDWLVLDGYQFNQTYRQLLQSVEYKLAVFDDTNNSGELHAELVINGAHNAELLNYQSTAANADLAIGSHYQVLRQEFLQLRKHDWSNRKTLVIMFGGSDPNNLTLQMLDSLQTVKVSMPITVITGNAFNHLHHLADVIEKSHLNITHLHDCQNMASVLVNSKLAISAAGGSQFELLACAVPAILVVVADNQKHASQASLSQGWCQVFQTNQLSTDQLASQCASLWQQTDLLQTMHHKALQFPVIDGARNIVELMGKNISSTRSQ